MPHLLFLSTHNFATNPRLVKEIDLALEKGYEVTVVCCAFNNWSKPNNEKIKQRLASRIHYYEIAGNRSPLFPWLMSTFWFRFAKTALYFFPDSAYWLSLRSNKRSWLLLRQLKKIKTTAGLVVAHNPGAFYPAWAFAQKNKLPFGIDLEDYHPGETNDAKEAARIKRLLRFVLPKAGYITAASPLILDYSLHDAGAVSCQTELVHNYFSKAEFESPGPPADEKIKLVWFSQNIAQGRGLEEVIPAVAKNKALELHLYGHLKPEFYQAQLASIENVFVHEPLPQAELHQALRGYDAGLAIEPGKDLNNTLAISNKILAYFQAGLFILASDTPAQKDFIENNPEHGLLTSLEESQLQQAFEKLAKHKNGAAAHRFERAAAYSWEKESEKLVRLWEGVRGER